MIWFILCLRYFEILFEKNLVFMKLIDKKKNFKENTLNFFKKSVIYIY